METLVRSVRLSEMDDMPAVPWGVYVGRFTDEEISAMRSRMRNRLRFDNRTGKTFDGRECIEAFRQYMTGTPQQMASPHTWIPYETREEIFEEFARQIFCECGREQRNRKEN